MSEKIKITRRFFRDGLTQSFGRHIRALERYFIYELATGLARIHVTLATQLPVGQARMVLRQYIFDRAAGGDEDLLPGEEFSGRTRQKHVHIIVGTQGMPPPDQLDGHDLESLENHLDPKARLALAHELGHLALHCLTDDCILRIPFNLSKQQVLEDEAKAYAAALVTYCSDYIRTKGVLLTPTPADVWKALEDLWGDDISARQGLRDMLWEIVQNRKIPDLGGGELSR